MYKILFLLMISSMIFSQSKNSENQVITLQDLEWKNRIIITFTNNEAINRDIRTKLFSEEAGIKDRDIIYFLITPQKSLSNSSYALSLKTQSDLIIKYFDDDEALKVILIGKDGGVKMQNNKLNLKKIFSRIDSMPMRIQEMKNKSENN